MCDGQDKDCDELVDGDDTDCTGLTTYYQDADGDGFPAECDNCITVHNPGQEDTDSDGIGDACDGCTCAFQCDYDRDGFLTALDLGNLIDVLFAGRHYDQDPWCPLGLSDFDGDGVATALDLGTMIDHLFGGGPGPHDPCAR